MELNNNKKDIFGIIFFALSFIIFAYMLITPLNQLILHIDEYFTMTLVNFPISDIISITGADVQPPLYYLILKAAIKLLSILGLGIHYLFILKVLSIIPYGILLIFSASKIRKEYGWLTAGLFTFSLAVMAEFFTYFLMARMYSWAILFTVLAFIYFKDVIDKGDMKSWALLTIFSVLGAYTHYFALISVLCIYLILLFYIISYKKDQIKTWGISVVVAILLYAPWILSFVNQLTNIHKSFWVPDATSETIIHSFGYFAYSGDTVFSIITIFILIAIGIIYLTQYKNQEDNFYILAGFGVYIGTIVLAIIISFIFKPILIARFLLPAAAVLWLAISILINKIENRRMFLFAFAFVVLLLVAGVGHTIATNYGAYENGIVKENIMNNITQDNNSTVILTKPNTIMYFLNYTKDADVYCFNNTYVMGENMARVHQIFDFKDLSEDNLTSFVSNNTDRNIYIITWGDLPLDSSINKTSLLSDRGLEISKLEAANTSEESYDETYYY